MKPHLNTKENEMQKTIDELIAENEKEVSELKDNLTKSARADKLKALGLGAALVIGSVIVGLGIGVIANQIAK
jgi:F0F1-type ATP synthase assembly protein I